MHEGQADAVELTDALRAAAGLGECVPVALLRRYEVAVSTLRPQAAAAVVETFGDAGTAGRNGAGVAALVAADEAVAADRNGLAPRAVEPALSSTEIIEPKFVSGPTVEKTASPERVGTQSSSNSGASAPPQLLSKRP